MKTKRIILILVIFIINLSQVFAQVDNRFRQPHSRNQFEVLVYTSPDHWHNLTEPVAILEFQEMAQRHAFGLTWTTVNSRFNDAALDQFDVIVFLLILIERIRENFLEELERMNFF